MAVTQRTNTALKILLLTLLVAAQGLGHAHAVDHLVTDDNTFCSICSLTGHGNATVDSAYAEIEIPLQRTIPVCRTHGLALAEIRRPTARAPPLS